MPAAAMAVISADSHIVEPADFWTRHIDKRFADRAPRASVDEGGVVHFVVDRDIPLGSVGAPSQAGLRFGNPDAITFEGTWDEVRPGCNRTGPRVQDMRLDGISGEVIYPTLGARLYGIASGELLSACFKAGNDWLVDFCRENPKLFKAVALLNTDDVLGAVTELRRSVRNGLAGGMIPTYPGELSPYDDPVYEPLWRTAEELHVPLSMHIAATRPGPGQLSIFTSEWNKPGAAAYSATQDYWVRRSVASMIFAGVFERHPGLKISIVEHELCWATYFLPKMDSTYKELSQTAPYRFKNDTLPSDFFRTNVFMSFQEDAIGLRELPSMIGTDTLMFGSDYPHAESTWPNSRQFLDKLLNGFAEADRDKLVHHNVAQLFGFD